MKALIAVLCVLVVGLAAGGAFVYTDSTKKIENLTAELAESKANAAKLETALADANAKLADSLAAGGKASKQSDTLAAVLAKRTSLEKLVNDQLFAEAQGIRRAQDALCTKPSKEAFDEYKQSLDKALATAERVAPMIADLTTYLQTNADSLANSADVVSDINTRMGRINKELPGLVKGLHTARDSCREAKMGVSSKEGWQSGDATIAKGEIAAIAASGTWMYYRSRGNQVGAGGEELGQKMYKIAENIPNGALIARVHGDENAAMAVPAVIADRDGKLEFRINDNQIDDNKGTIDIVIWMFTPVSGM